MSKPKTKPTGNFWTAAHQRAEDRRIKRLTEFLRAEIEDMPDCGGMQGYAVASHYTDVVKTLADLIAPIKAVRHLKLKKGNVLLVQVPKEWTSDPRCGSSVRALAATLGKALKDVPVLVLPDTFSMKVLNIEEMAQLAARIENARITAALADGK